jgi:hypothetical protein
MEEVARSHRANVAKREELLDEVRELPGFEDFLKPARFAFLREAAGDHPVVAINISAQRCDALVIFSSHPIKHIPLPKLTLGMVDQLCERFMICAANDLRSHRVDRTTKYDKSHSTEPNLNSILGELWNLVVGPIWEEMKHIVSATSD